MLGQTLGKALYDKMLVRKLYKTWDVATTSEKAIHALVVLAKLG